MKKVLLILLALFLTVSLTACGNDSGEESDKGNNEESSEVEGNKSSEGGNEASESLEKIELYSDDTKMVFKSANSQLVYYYEGEKITAYHAYIDYENAATANYALNIMEKDDEVISKAYTKGRYLVIEYAKSEYENLKTSEVRALYSYLEQVQDK